ncbi:MAG: efflux RND transporter periplasmic adaptor subunit [Planctomycetota bacterium]
MVPRARHGDPGGEPGLRGSRAAHRATGECGRPGHRGAGTGATRSADAKAQFERMDIAAKTGAVSRQDLDNARAAYDASDAQVRIREKAVEDTVMRAKFAGTIAATYVENFQNVNAKQPVLRLLDTSKVEMWVSIPESLIAFAEHVVDIRVRFDVFPGREIAARIKEIGREASSTTRTYPVNLIMDQPADIKILPGMAGSVNGRIVLPEAPETFEVPLSALTTPDNDQNYIWVIQRGAGDSSGQESIGEARRREVKVEGTTARGVLITGVQVGELVATAGADTLEEGQKVRILPPAEGS